MTAPKVTKTKANWIVVGCIMIDFEGNLDPEYVYGPYSKAKAERLAAQMTDNERWPTKLAGVETPVWTALQLTANAPKFPIVK